MATPFDSADWTEESLAEIWKIVRGVAKDEFKLDFYEPYFEVCTFEEMIQIESTGFPIMFNHWSFGKTYEEHYRRYQNNHAGVAYEVIFNTDPALCYLLETNTTVMQALVMSHAAVGHSAFFKKNQALRDNTNARTIIPFMKTFRNYVIECEHKYGADKVEKILDVCFSLFNYAIDKAEKPVFTKEQRETQKLKRELEKEKDFDLLVDTLAPTYLDRADTTGDYPPEENILKFVAKYSPSLKNWERELILMFCKKEQYFYPQRLTHMMNEGYASFWHYNMMHKLYDLGHLNEGDVLEFTQSHTGVLCQRDMDDKHYHGINPYKLGYEIFNDIKRICQNPTEEDRIYSPGLIGKDWIEEVNFAATHFKDSSFVLQYLTPKIVRDLKFVQINNDSRDSFYGITAIHDTDDFKTIRKALEDKFDHYGEQPYMAATGAALKGDRALFIHVKETQNQEVDTDSLHAALMQLKKLWPYPIKVTYEAKFGEIYTQKI